jgi:flagellar biosynthesis component FlhA
MGYVAVIGTVLSIVLVLLRYFLDKKRKKNEHIKKEKEKEAIRQEEQDKVIEESKDRMQKENEVIRRGEDWLDEQWRKFK